MNIVILSGGSGKRLWPLSNDTQSKQFLRLLKNGDGEYESMVERVMRQIREAQPGAEITISCYAPQEEIIKRQLGDIDIIAEPERRDTFPAVALAAAHLRYAKKLNDGDTFVVCPIDPFADSSFFRLFEDAENTVKTGQGSIGLIGAMPTYPSEKYGYIMQKDGAVTGFAEKPCMEKAKRLIENGALWNCGVFALKIGYVLRHAGKYCEFDSFESLYEQYGKLPKISIDYEIAEKESSIGVKIYEGVWKDLGTWNTLTEEMSGNIIGDNVIMSGTCKDTHILNMLNIPIIAQDLKDTVVVASHDGILVSSKPGSSYLKPLAEQIKIQPMYGQRKWGNYRVLDSRQSGGSISSSVKRVHIDAGHAAEWQSSPSQSITLVVIGGKGIINTDGKGTKTSRGNIIGIEQGKEYSILAISNMELIEVLISGDSAPERGMTMN